MSIVKWLAAGMVLISVALAVVFTTRFGNDPNIVDSPLLGKTAPAIMSAWALHKALKRSNRSARSA